MSETERTDEAEAFAASADERKYEYTEKLEASVTGLKHSLVVALEDLDAAREAQTSALAKLTARYKTVRGSLGSMLNRAGQLEADLCEEQAALRHDRVDGLLRRFANLAVYNARVRRIEAALHLGAGRRPSGVAETSAEAQHGTNKSEQGTAGDDPGSASDSDDSHQSRLDRVAQHTSGSAPPRTPADAKTPMLHPPTPTPPPHLPTPTRRSLSDFSTRSTPMRSRSSENGHRFATCLIALAGRGETATRTADVRTPSNTQL